VIADYPQVQPASILPLIQILRQRHRLRLPSSFARRYQCGCWRVIEADGELDIQAVPLLRALLAGEPAHVVFDLRRVTFMDASVLGVLAASRCRSHSQVHPAVRVAEPAGQVGRVLEITGLSRALTIFSSFDRAFAGHDSC
jgi:anti-anti-sigma factor